MTVSEEELLSRRHRVTVGEYYRMAELGLLAPEARVELVAGEIIDMTPSGPQHGGHTSLLDYALKEAVGSSALVRVQLPIRLDEHNEPEPDIAVVEPRADFYKSQHPVASDVLLVVEVSDATLRYDRDVKMPLYAASGIPEMWIIDLKSRLIHTFRSPGPSGYANVAETGDPGLVTLAALPSVRVNLAALFSTR